MRLTTKKLVCVTGLLATMVLAGCNNYYMVREPSSGNAYYTTEKDGGRTGKGGEARFTDARTNKEVALSTSEVTRITKEEFDRATGRP